MRREGKGKPAAGSTREVVPDHHEANGQTAWLIDAAVPSADTSDFPGSVRCDAVGEGLFTAVALEMDRRSYESVNKSLKTEPGKEPQKRGEKIPS